MRIRTPAIALLLVLAAIVPPAPASATTSEDSVRRIDRSIDAADLRDLSIDMPVGKVVLTGTDGDRVDVEVTIECDEHGWGSASCPDRAEDIELVTEKHGSRLEVDLEGYSTWSSRHMEVTLHIDAPARLASVVDLGIGEVDVERMADHLSVDLGIGEVNVRMAESDVASVDLDAGVGEASLRGNLGRRESSGLFVKELTWNDGSGRARVRVDVGIGEIDVRLSGS